jgi:folylpolyglutamate synthase/dihydropteroate synthase
LSYKLFNSSPEAYCNIKENIKEEHMVMVTGSTFIVADILKYFGKV